ncbi:MAG: hypothetical protein R6V00_00830 [Candidatus Aminicenantes bacterium]
MKKNWMHTFLLLFFLINIPFTYAQQKEKTSWDGNRTVPVHNILLKDEFDQKIVPTESYPLPFSTRYTCAPCHNYNQIQQGLHFSPLSSNQDGRPGEPWFWVDLDTGTVLPVSYRDWPRTFHPEELDLTFWEFTLLFGRHMLGGEVSEPELDERSPDSRWNASGKLEINCLACHNHSRKQSHSEWTFQILRENFRWAATASSGLGEVGGMASRLPGTWDIYDGPNPDDTQYAVVPFVQYDQSQFNSKHEVFVDLNHKPDDERCLVCHSVSSVYQRQFLAESDVHTAAGIQCVDCHRNDLSHTMIRGYEGESEQMKMPSASDFTCRGCHLRENKSIQKAFTAGRLGAPYPTHKKIPPVHMEKLSCTACHSGSIPEKNLNQVKSSRANRMGIYGIARWDMDYPVIQEPVFQRDSNGKLTPHRLVWPSFWGYIQENEVHPLRPSTVQEKAGQILHPESGATEILSAFSTIPDNEGTPVFISSGKLYKLSYDGGLNAFPYPGDTPEIEIYWALKNNSTLIPLIPEFDVDSDPIERDIEYRIQDTLAVLDEVKGHPGKPALVYKNKIFQISEGYLKKREWEGKAQDIPRLCWLQEDEIKNLISELNLRCIIETAGHQELFTEEQVQKILRALYESDPSKETETDKDYVYVSNGRMFRLDSQGNLEVTKHPAVQPVLWPLAHQVRPLQKSLGINGCSDCHSLGSKFFFAEIQGTGPVKTSQRAQRSAHSFMGMVGIYQKIFGVSFYARPVLKVILFISAFVMACIALIMIIKFLGFITGLLEKRR